MIYLFQNCFHSRKSNSSFYLTSYLLQSLILLFGGFTSLAFSIIELPLTYYLYLYLNIIIWWIFTSKIDYIHSIFIYIKSNGFKKYIIYTTLTTLSIYVITLGCIDRRFWSLFVTIRPFVVQSQMKWIIVNILSTLLLIFPFNISYPNSKKYFRIFLIFY